MARDDARRVPFAHIDCNQDNGECAAREGGTVVALEELMHNLDASSWTARYATAVFELSPIGGDRSGRATAYRGAFLAIAISLSGCFVQASGDPPPPPPPPSAGDLTLRWTVDATIDSNVCIMGQASMIDIVLSPTDGQPSGEYQAACSDFATNVSELRSGEYVGTARLIDPGGQARTTTLQLNPFVITSGSRLVIDVDFPANSFR